MKPAKSEKYVSLFSIGSNFRSRYLRLGDVNDHPATAPSISCCSFKKAAIGPSSINSFRFLGSMVTPYKSAPNAYSRPLDIRIANNSKALPAKIRKLKQSANMMAVLVLRFLLASIFL